MSNGDFQTWGERLFYPKKIKIIRSEQQYRLIGSKPPSSGFYQKKRTAIEDLKGRLHRVANRTPEVMVKITSSGHSSKNLKNHLDYISRNGQVLLTTEKNEKINNKISKLEIEQRWGHDLTEFGESKYAESYHLIFSMPPQTPRDDFNLATEETIKKLFGGHQYYYAQHNDTAHPHIHVAVKAISVDGKRLPTKKADLHRWREVYAHTLRSYGLHAEATKRVHRGKILKADKSSIYQMKRRGQEPGFDNQQRQQQYEKAQKGFSYSDTRAVQRARKSRYAVLSIYSNLIDELQKSNQASDKKLASELKLYLKRLKNQVPSQKNYFFQAKAELEKANKLKAQLQEQNRIKDSKKKDISHEK